MHSDDSINISTINTVAQTSDFIKVQSLGFGAYGTVASYIYNGFDPTLLALSSTKQPGGTIVIKMFHHDKVDMHEVRNVSYLSQGLLPRESLRYPQQAIINLEGKICIASELIQHGVNQSSDLEKFLSDMSNHLGFFSGKFQIEAAKYALQGFAQAIVTAQQQLHSVGLLHLDTALRNFLVTQPQLVNGAIKFSAKISDFGLSGKYNEQGKYERAYLNLPQQDLLLPYSMLNQETLIKTLDPNTNTAKITFTIHTDIFSRKAALMEMLIVWLGHQRENILAVDMRVDKNNPHLIIPRENAGDYFHQRHSLGGDKPGDEYLLQKYLENVSNVTVLEIVKGNPRAAMVREFLDAYKPYLTTMPNRDLSIAAIETQDMALFQQAHDRYQATLSSGLSEQHLASLLPVNAVDAWYQDEMDTDDEMRWSDDAPHTPSNHANPYLQNNKMLLDNSSTLFAKTPNTVSKKTANPYQQNPSVLQRGYLAPEDDTKRSDNQKTPRKR